jgi:hypothetical protein
MTKDLKAKHMVTFIMLSSKGDERHIWDSCDPKQITEALEKFEDLLKRGFSAFLVGVDGVKSKMLKSGDFNKEDVRQAEEILFIQPIAGG